MSTLLVFERWAFDDDKDYEW